MLWVAFGLLAALSAAVLSFALLRRARGAAPRAAHDLEVYRAQLKELERERESGLISEAEAKAARLEIERHILAADPERAPQAAKAAKGRERVPAVLVAAAVPLAAFGLYFLLGNPEVPSVPFAEQAERRAQEAAARREAAEADLPGVETMLARVRERLAQDPDNLRDWIVLASSLSALGDFEEAATAYDHALRLSADDPGLHSARAEALILAAQGQVTAEAQMSLTRALELDPQNPRARFYLAAAKQQAGDMQGAFDDLAALLRGAPADAPWIEVVHERAAALASGLGLDPAAVLPARPVAAGARQAADELAARLEANPKDYQGWIALARARAGLGDRAGARAALERGAEVYEAAPFVLQQFQQAAAELGLDESPGAEGPRGPSREDMEAAAELTPEQQEEMIRGMVGGLAERLKDRPDDLQGWQMLARSYGVLGERAKAAEAYDRVLALAPNDPDALFFLGEAALEGGDPDEAAEYWTRLLTQLAPGSAEHVLVQDRLNALKAAN